MCYLSRGMDPDGRVEQNVVTQLLEQQDPILQVAKVSGKGQYNVQDRPRHMHLGRLAQRETRRHKVTQMEVREEKKSIGSTTVKRRQSDEGK